MHKKVISKTKPSGTDQYGHKRTRIYTREKWWQTHFQGGETCLRGKVPLTPRKKQMLCSILQVCLLLPCHHVFLEYGHRLGLQFPSPWNVSTAQLHQHSAVVLGLSLRKGYEHKNHSSENQKFQAIEKGKNKTSAFLCLLCLNFSLKSLALLFQVFLQLYWKSRAVERHTFLKLC